MQFTLTCRDEDGTVTEKRFDSVYLDNVVGNIGDFLRGCGFYFDELEVTNDSIDESPFVQFLSETEEEVPQTN